MRERIFARRKLTVHRCSVLLPAMNQSSSAELLLHPRVRTVTMLLWGVGWVVVALLLLLPVGAATPARTDLLAHFLMFGSMAFAAVGFSRRPWQLAALALFTIAAGAALELAQALVPYRTFDPIDAVANGLGAVVGFGAALAVLCTWIRPAETALRRARA